jgi:lipopolysaccharide transport system permease protein
LAVKPSALPQPDRTTVQTDAVTIIEASRGWSALRLKELWEYRDLLYFMTIRDIQTRYRQMALGPLWIVFQPLLTMVLYTVIFGNIAQLPSEGQPYAVFTFTALLPWGIFSNMVSAASGCLLDNRHLLNKVYFPRLIIPLSKVMSGLIDFAIAFAILLLMMVAYGQWPTWGILLLPFFLGIAILAGLAVGLWFAGVIVRYRDFGQVLGVMMRFWMYATPVVYSMELVPDTWLWLYQLNPMVGVVEGFRWALLGTGQPPSWLLVISAVLCGLLLVGGLFNFRRVERTIVDIA